MTLVVGRKVRLYGGEVVRVIAVGFESAPPHSEAQQFYALVEAADGRLRTESLEGAAFVPHGE